ncbi:Fanconi anemia complementation group D2 family protein [Acanthamoeba castellanii str. Neff]|uniref:Fanconi anemia complementation group D2 family protein n=1 Tax=Acanthamoeba castellanii (strain ATCC 30010 / Neff) TaxID=1257118 RepID=L8GJ52_ACACF|nr:Fanconi anemia complementation group D2 family protein [Acanthamoeba castellanii str. Neff]ELR12879.1 Fanconi anemia complementation group D2 family protein [Acanthamoeba castellanii str. Neff]
MDGGKATKRLGDASRQAANPPKKKPRVGDAAEGEQHEDAFTQVLAAAGATIKGETVLIDDGVVFKRKVQRALGSDAAQLRRFEAALEGLVDDDAQLKNFLRPVVAKTNRAGAGQHDNLVKLLLGVEAVQPFLIDRLLEKLPQFVDDGGGNYGDSLPRQLLAQLRWLDNVVAGQRLTEKLCEALQACPLYLRREIITALPEIIDDYAYEAMVRELRGLMEEERALTVPILDTLANMNLPAELLEDVQTTVLRSLRSVEVEDLPVVVRFLLRSITKSNVDKVVRKLRRHLDFGGPSAANTGEAMTLDSLRSGVRFQKDVTKAFLKEIQAAASAAEQKVLDIWILLVLAGHFTPELVTHAVAGHGHTLRGCFPSLLGLADYLLRASEPAIRRHGGLLYVLAFRHFPDTYHRQEVLGALVAHIGSGSPHEVDGTLDVFERLAHQASGCAHLAGVLEYLDGLAESHARRLLVVFARVAAAANKGAVSRLSDDLHILIRKYLAAPSERHKRLAILGSLAALRVPQEDGVDSHALLDNLLHSCQSSSACMAFLYDELAALVQEGAIDEKLVDKLSQYLTAAATQLLLLLLLSAGCAMAEGGFTELFLADIPEGEHDNAEYWMNLDGTEAALALKLRAIVETGMERGREIAPLQALLKSTHIRLHQSMREMDGLLGCPLSLYPPSSVLRKHSNGGDEEADATTLSPKPGGRAEQHEYVAALRPFFREIKPHVCLVLAYPDTESQQGKPRAVTLDVLAVAGEVESRLTHLVASTKRAGPGRRPHLPVLSDSLGAQVLGAWGWVPVFGAMHEHLQRIAHASLALAQRQAAAAGTDTSSQLIEPSDPVESGASQSAAELESCMVLLLGCFEKLFLLDDLFAPDCAALRKAPLPPLPPRHLLLSLPVRAAPRPAAPDFLAALSAAQGGRAGGGGSGGNGGQQQQQQQAEVEGLFQAFAALSEATTSLRAILALTHLLATLVKRASPSQQQQQQPEEEEEQQQQQQGRPKFRSLTGDTFPAYYRALLAHLDACLTDLPLANSGEEPSVALAQCNQLVLLFQALCQLSRCELPAPALTALLRRGRTFLDRFMKVMPFLSAHFLGHQEEILSTFKSLQQATRTLQALCAHSKVEKLVVLVNLVPPMRRSLELLLYKVKAMLIENDSLGAFSLGNLKHRDLAGREVPSQLDLDQYDDDDDDDDDEDGEGEEAAEKEVAAEDDESATTSDNGDEDEMDL